MGLKLLLTDKTGRCFHQSSAYLNFIVLKTILTAPNIPWPLSFDSAVLSQSRFAQVSPALSPSCFLLVWPQHTTTPTM